MTATVVKLGGEVVRSDAIAAIAADIAELRSREDVVVVHGGGPQATELQKKLGQTPNIVAGRRITDDDALSVMKMIVAGQVNVDLCAHLRAAGARPVGLHDAVSATKRPPRVVSGGGADPIDFGHVGDVTGVDRELIALLLGSGYLPVLACLGTDRGAVFNINADIVANQVSILLDARALVIVSDVPGVLRDIADPTSRIAKMTREDGKRAIETGIVTKGMIPKLEESFAAIDQGVRAVHIVGKISRSDIVRAVTEPGSVGTVLVP